MEKYDLIIVGAGPAGIFTAVELLRHGSKKKILPVPWPAGRAGPDHQRAVPRFQPEKGRLFAAAYRLH